MWGVHSYTRPLSLFRAFLSLQQLVRSWPGFQTRSFASGGGDIQCTGPALYSWSDFGYRLGRFAFEERPDLECSCSTLSCPFSRNSVGAFAESFARPSLAGRCLREGLCRLPSWSSMHPARTALDFVVLLVCTDSCTCFHYYDTNKSHDRRQGDNAVKFQLRLVMCKATKQWCLDFGKPRDGDSMHSSSTRWSNLAICFQWFGSQSSLLSFARPSTHFGR